MVQLLVASSLLRAHVVRGAQSGRPSDIIFLVLNKTPRARGGQRSMAPRQLQLELNEVDMTADKGSKRVRVDRADESSMQV